MTRHILSPGEACLAIGAGLVVGAVAGGVGSLSLAPVAGWCAAGVIVLVQVWRRCWPQDSEGTRQLAREESESHLTDTAIIAACLGSVGAMVLALTESHNAQDPTSVFEVVLGVLGTMVAWALVNTVFALKYARMYYLDQHNHGLDFEQDKPPTYSDFAYFAFTIGMSYATSEIEPTDSDTRRKALPHALLSYFFGTVLIAVAINLVTNIGQN